MATNAKSISSTAATASSVPLPWASRRKTASTGVQKKFNSDDRPAKVRCYCGQKVGEERAKGALCTRRGSRKPPPTPSWWSAPVLRAGPRAPGAFGMRTGFNVNPLRARFVMTDKDVRRRLRPSGPPTAGRSDLPEPRVLRGSPPRPLRRRARPRCDRRVGPSTAGARPQSWCSAPRSW